MSFPGGPRSGRGTVRRKQGTKESDGTVRHGRDHGLSRATPREPHRVLTSGLRKSPRNAKRVFIPFSFQPPSGLANSGFIPVTENAGRMDVAEALDLSEKLVCADRPVPQSWGPGSQGNRGVSVLHACSVVTVALQDPSTAPAWVAHSIADGLEKLGS